MKKKYCLFILLMIFLSACVQTPKAAGEFAIYLVDGQVPLEQSVQGKLEDISLEKTPLITSDDIQRYTADSHEMDLTPAGNQKIRDLDVPVSGGRPFVVCVGEERIYGGAFWTMLSSASFDGIVIQVPLLDDFPLKIQLGYPESPELFAGVDRRGDQRILEALQQDGKLQ